MKKLEKSGGIIALQYEWKLNYVTETIILSKAIKYKKNGSFQVGLKKLSNPSWSTPTLIFIASNLHKIGLRVERVSFISSQTLLEFFTHEDTQMHQKIGKRKLQLFTAHPIHFDSFCTTITFTVYLTTILENYQVHQMDGLLISQQLLSSTQNVDVDFNLIAEDGERFPVHKWMLAARSSVFAVLLSEDKDNELNQAIMDCNEDVMNQFIKFIYTGEFEGFGSEGLLQLAVKYEIKTLQELCKTASKEASLIEISRLIPWNLKPGSSYIDYVFPESDTDLIMMNEKTNVSIFKFTWELCQSITEKHNGTKRYVRLEKQIVTSEEFENRGEKLFQAELLLWGYQSYQDTITLKFLSYNHPHINWIIENFTCCINQERKDTSKERCMIMSEKSTGDDRELRQMFSCVNYCLSSSISYPFLATFYVKMRSTAPDFTNKLVDSIFGEQLWAAVVNRKMVDVQFFVGEESFGAHRSLLSARSPVFAAMFSSGMKEAETDQVCIEDVDPDTFKQFLKFLYTGMFEPSSMDSDLFEVADRYQVETLMELCRPATLNG